MAINEHAGRPAEPSMLVDVDRLVRAYSRDPAGPDRSGPARRVRDVRASRLVAQRRVQRGPHRGHDGGDLPLPHGAGHRRPAVHRARHARPLRAGLPDGAPGPGRARCRRPRRRRRRLHADAGHLARDPRPQPGPPRPPGRRDRRHPVAQPARGRRLQVQPAERRPGRHGCHLLDPGRGEPAAGGEPRRRPPHPDRARPRPGHRLRLRHDLCRRSRLGHRHGRDPRVRAAPRASIPWVGRAWPTGRRSRSATAWT